MITTGYASFPADAGTYHPQGDFTLPPPSAGAEPVLIAGPTPAEPAAQACRDDITALNNIKARMDRLAEELRQAPAGNTRYIDNLLTGIQREAAAASEICARIEQNCANLGIPASELVSVRNLCDEMRTVGRAAQDQRDAMRKGRGLDLGAVANAIGEAGGTIASIVLMILNFLSGTQRQGAF